MQCVYTEITLLLLCTSLEAETPRYSCCLGLWVGATGVTQGTKEQDLQVPNVEVPIEFQSSPHWWIKEYSRSVSVRAMVAQDFVKNLVSISGACRMICGNRHRLATTVSFGIQRIINQYIRGIRRFRRWITRCPLFHPQLVDSLLKVVDLVICQPELSLELVDNVQKAAHEQRAIAIIVEIESQVKLSCSTNFRRKVDRDPRPLKTIRWLKVALNQNC